MTHSEALASIGAHQESVPIDVEFSGLLTDYPIFSWNENPGGMIVHPFTGNQRSSPTKMLRGTLGNAFTFCLINEDKKDTEFWLRSTPDYVSVSVEEDQRHLFAFRAAVAFVHGKHAWPFIERHRRSGQICLDRIRSPEKVASTEHNIRRSTIDAINTRLEN